MLNNSVTNTGRYKAIAGGLGISLNLPTAVNAVIENNIISNNELHCVVSMGAGIYIVYWEPGGVITDNYPSPIISNNIWKTISYIPIDSTLRHSRLIK